MGKLSMVQIMNNNCSLSAPCLLLDQVEQYIVICQWRADQLFAEAEG